MVQWRLAQTHTFHCFSQDRKLYNLLTFCSKMYDHKAGTVLRTAKALLQTNSGIVAIIRILFVTISFKESTFALVQKPGVVLSTVADLLSRRSGRHRACIPKKLYRSRAVVEHVQKVLRKFPGGPTKPPPPRGPPSFFNFYSINL